MRQHWLESGDPWWLPVCRWSGVFAVYLCVLLLLTSCGRGGEPQVSAPPAPPEEVKTTALKETSVVATLDSPLPDHRNTIWCGTLQLAWDRLKDDIIREPISLVGAHKLSSELNNSRLSTDDLDPGSFYADAGLVSDGILERIQEQMAQRFPSEPKPAFSDQYRQPLPTIVAYSYLYTDIPFTHAFSSRPIAFTFRQSDDTHGKTSAFWATVPAARDQVDILDYDPCGGFDSAEFAVDLCKHTRTHPKTLRRRMTMQPS